MTSRIRSAYDIRVEEGVIAPDPAQAPLIEAMERLETGLAKKGLFGKPAETRGLYIWGPPGRGKSMLMDLFYSSTPEQKKVRAHFHAFMARIHDLVKQWREGDAKTRKAVFGTHKGDDPIPPIARLIASEARLLCFDEFQVTDIADAMLLGRLFETLFAANVVVVATSNRPPHDLYLNGINRQLFLPFIDMLEEKLSIHRIAGPTDYRLDRIKGLPVYLTPDDAAATAALDEAWARLTDDDPGRPLDLDVMGRKVTLPRYAHNVARASFADLCAAALGPGDYLAIAESVHTLILDRIPTLTAAKRNEAKRFVTLIDALYEARRRFVCSAEAPPERLYPEGDGAFEFERTVSRLMEMQSARYLDAAD